VLYLSIGEPREAAYADTTPEGHALRYDERGELIGVTFINAAWILERDGDVVVSIPVPSHVPAEDIGPALAGTH
jgi:YD repeat-containing protein